MNQTTREGPYSHDLIAGGPAARVEGEDHEVLFVRITCITEDRFQERNRVLRTRDQAQLNSGFVDYVKGLELQLVLHRNVLLRLAEAARLTDTGAPNGAAVLNVE